MNGVSRVRCLPRPLAPGGGPPPRGSRASFPTLPGSGGTSEIYPPDHPLGLREDTHRHIRKPAGFSGTPAYRLRVGDYRVILTIEDEHLLIRRDTGAASPGGETIKEYSRSRSSAAYGTVL